MGATVPVSGSGEVCGGAGCAFGCGNGKFGALGGAAKPSEATCASKGIRLPC